MKTEILTHSPFPKAATAWLETRRPHLSPRTQWDYEQYIKTLSLVFGETRLPEITGDHLRAYQDMRRDRCGGGRINQELSIVQQMMKRIGRWPMISHDYQPLPNRRQSPGRALADDEYERLFRIAATDRAWEVAYLFACISVNTTAGPKECLTLRLQDVDLRERSMRVQPKGAKNNYRIRVIPLNPMAWAAMSRLLELALERGVTEPDHYIFPFRVRGNRMGGTYDPTRRMMSCNTAWVKMTAAAGLKGLRMYDLRHTAITYLLENPDVSEETAKSIAGHISEQIMRRYSHTRFSEKRRALDALVRKVPRSVRGGKN